MSRPSSSRRSAARWILVLALGVLSPVVGFGQAPDVPANAEVVARYEQILERALLEHALSELEEAHIGTIHAFSADLLRQHPIEARVDPLFEGADDDQQTSIYEEAFTAWFQRTLTDPPEGVRRVLRGRRGARDALRTAGRDLVGQRAFGASWQRPGRR